MIEEGRARIITEGVFYNSRMKFCRDLDMVIFSEIDSAEYLDALAASGVRGIRAALEASKQPIFNDLNPKAVEIIKRNLELNGLEAEVHCMDASILMRGRSFEHVDIDPFGSPATFIDSACFSARKYLSVTATDTAALCGSATNSGLKKYGAYAVKTDTYHETGLRMLIGFVVREATKYEKALTPLISWAKEHYYRVHFCIRKSTSKAGEIYEKVGYINFCPRCLRKEVTAMGECRERCECGSKFVMLGPLWLGELKQSEFVTRIYERSEGKLRYFVEKLKEEVEVATAYNLQQMASRVSERAPPTMEVVKKLREMGYKASKTHYCGFCIKTDAKVGVLAEVIKYLS
ncbi:MULTISPECIES: tRNA (guanine(10)-N(2))-dimethyltransferase [unclassified Archaeoglobus]|jgi:tRNA (guanine26-N2/guanine27-N2)-dimethyltransferase|uniref:tRNA (guanine(10)-N(2))-dimethyltransferase n=1 Tax=unclassified Archaeoglobus TaxID=2643606 RepID=UPI0025BDC131|nr:MULTISPECIES: tRNA (guanine(10)-N(2))-dimethyltransferase [unclassified Archaeoglobus]